MTHDEAIQFVLKLLALMVKKGGSDLFITAGFPAAIKVDGLVTPVSKEPLSAESSALCMRALMNDRQLKEFDATNECNFAVAPAHIGRFRVSAFVQQGCVGGVLRTIQTEIPKMEDLGLPEQLKEIVMQKRGLVLLVGATGSGKSTSIAAMMGYRNEHSQGHIVTIEDPIEYVHPHRHCVVTQREVGVDTMSWDNALKNTLRQAPDVIFIGEIRTRETMEYALSFAETGHLVLSTLHANNANQALDRIIDFFPEDRRAQVLMDLSLNTRAIVSQRLVRREKGGRVAAMGILVNSPLIADLIFKGEVAKIAEVMAESPQFGMITLDQYLFKLYEERVIGFEEALRNADSQNGLRLRIKLESKRSPEDLMKSPGVINMGMKEEKETAWGLRVNRNSQP
ncbi:MAG TPA: PilT/PilU family type 4a pilus ATPase [Nevskiaceae bacterium]